MRSTSKQVWQRGQRDDLTLSEVLYALWSQRTLVLGVVLVFALAALVFSMFQETVYRAEAEVNVDPRGALDTEQDTEAFVDDVFRSVNTDELREEAMQRANLQKGELQFERQLSVQTLSGQNGAGGGLLVRYSAPAAGEAARAANAYATLFVERVNQLNDRLAGGSVAAEASMRERAVVPEQPSSPRPLIYTLLAAGVGLLVGGAGAFLLESRTQNWRGARDAELTLRAPVIGVIPEYSPEEEV